MKTVTIEQVYNLLTKQYFADWYGTKGAFEAHICGDPNCKTKKEILVDLEELFSI